MIAATDNSCDLMTVCIANNKQTPNEIFKKNNNKTYKRMCMKVVAISLFHINFFYVRSILGDYIHSIKFITMREF